VLHSYYFYSIGFITQKYYKLNQFIISYDLQITINVGNLSNSILCCCRLTYFKLKLYKIIHYTNKSNDNKNIITFRRKYNNIILTIVIGKYPVISIVDAVGKTRFKMT